MIETTARIARGTHRGAAALSRLTSLGRPAVMGILNITPDSFSDGGQHLTPRDAHARAVRMIEEGANLIDVGAESTRPYGARPISADEETRRLAPVLSDIVTLGVPVSIDSMKASVVAMALDQGAAIANDVWGLQRDPDMARVVAEHDAGLVIMHNRDTVDATIDIIAEIRSFFRRSLDIAAKAGIPFQNIMLDPGIGFGKSPKQSLTVLARLHEVSVERLPLLVGASRKRFIASVSPSEPDQRIGGSIAAHLAAVQAGASIIRSHDVYETVQATRVFAAIRDRR